MTSEKAQQLVQDIRLRTMQGSLRWMQAPGETYIAVAAGRLSLSYDARNDFLRVSTTGPTSEDLYILSHSDYEKPESALDTDLIVPDLTKLRAEIERSLQKDVEQRVDEFLSILAKS